MGTGQAEGVKMRTKPGEQRGLGEGRARWPGRSEALEAEVGSGGREALGSNNV